MSILNNKKVQFGLAAAAGALTWEASKAIYRFFTKPSETKKEKEKEKVKTEAKKEEVKTEAKKEEVQQEELKTGTN